MGERRERISRGATILDRHYPGWERRVDVSRLDQGSYDRCVLAQVAGYGQSYGKGKQNLGALAGLGQGWDGGHYGFDDADSRDNGWWKEEIHARLSRAPEVQPEPVPEQIFEGSLVINGIKFNFPPTPFDYVMKFVEANK
jgi:hypothetical protein